LVRTEPVFLTGILGAANRTDTMRGGQAYSVFNPLSQNLSLRFPPTNVQSSLLNADNSLQKKKDIPAAGPWSVKLGIIANDSEYCSSIYCASTPLSKLPRFYPISPSLSPIKAGVFDALHKQIYGHAASGDLSTGGASFDIVCKNTLNAPRPVKIKLEKALGLPSGIKAGFVAAGARNETILSDSFQTVLGPMQENTMHLVVGTDKYISNTIKLLFAKLSFLAVPMNRGLRIVYSLPYDTRSVQVKIFNLAGRSIMSRQITGEMLAYSGSVVLPGPLAKGFYIVELKALAQGALQPQILSKKVAYVQ
jgi:hypothetical protein